MRASYTPRRLCAVVQGETASLADRGHEDATKAIRHITRVLPEIVVEELREDKDLQPADTDQKAWEREGLPPACEQRAARRRRDDHPLDGCAAIRPDPRRAARSICLTPQNPEFLRLFTSNCAMWSLVRTARTLRRLRTMRHLRSALALLLALSASSLLGCSADTSSPGTATPGEEQDVTADAATLKLTKDFQTNVVGEPVAGKGLRVEYALERLPSCRGNVGGGGGPAWNVTGFYSENGGEAMMFEVSTLSADGKDRVAKAGRIVPVAGGDLAIWFQVSSGFGCSAYDSSRGQNYHLGVKGAVPVAGASIAFDKSGDPKVDGELKAGGKVRVTYTQDRLPDCRRTERGNPVWNITGFAQVDGEKVRTFDTAQVVNGDRQEVEALVELPHGGDLSLWFQVVSLGGCMKYDSKSGANYHFKISE